MSDIFFTGITDAIDLEVLNLQNRMDRRKIISTWAESVGLFILFENTYLGKVEEKTYRFQVQEYKDVAKEDHQFRFSNLDSTDYIVVIVQDSDNEFRFNAVKVKVSPDNKEEIEGKTISYKKFLEFAGEEEKTFDI